VAKESGLPWKLFTTTGADLVENIPEVIRATGGECDVACSQDAFLGPMFYEAMAEEYDFLLRGDEIWGWGDTVRSTQEAFVQCLLFNLNELPHPERLLRQSALTASIDALHEERRKISEASPYISERRFDDFKDEVYWDHRESRLLQNMAHYRRGFIPHLAPLMYDRTLDVIQKIPAPYRVRKKMFLSAMRMAFPKLFSIQGDVRPRMGLNLERAISLDSKLQELISECLVDNLPVALETVFDRDRLKAWVNRTIHQEGAPTVRTERHVYSLLRSLNAKLRKVPFIRSFLLDIARRSGRLRFPVVSSNYVFRLSILSLALRHYE
jgi:hypothetical protein